MNLGPVLAPRANASQNPVKLILAYRTCQKKAAALLQALCQIVVIAVADQDESRSLRAGTLAEIAPTRSSASYCPEHGVETKAVYQLRGFVRSDRHRTVSTG